jgi:serine/threonine-protein kinase
MIDGYRVLRLLGRGGTSVVYLATRETRGGRTERVALKLLLPHLAKYAATQRMLFDEAAIVARIRHPNVAGVAARGLWLGIPYVGLELVDGRSYAQLIREARRNGVPIPLGFHLSILAQIASGLHAAHTSTDCDGEPAGVVHRDVKPQNVMIGHDGTVKLIDFSIATARSRLTQTRVGSVKGSLNYMAPEQITHPKSVNHRADVWSLGVTAWEALTGHKLFRARVFTEAALSIVYGTIPHVRALAPTVPEDIADLVMQCLSRDPSQRPDTCYDIATAFWIAAARRGFCDDAAIADQIGRVFESSRTIQLNELNAESEPPPPPLESSRLALLLGNTGTGAERAAANDGTALCRADQESLTTLDISVVYEDSGATKATEPKTDTPTPDARPALAQPDARPALAQPDARPALAQPDARPALAQPDARPALAQPDAQPTPTQADARSTPTQPDSRRTPTLPDGRLTPTQPISRLAITPPRRRKPRFRAKSQTAWRRALVFALLATAAVAAAALLGLYATDAGTKLSAVELCAPNTPDAKLPMMEPVSMSR